MSEHLKRLNAPDSWHIAKKTTKFITKTAPGPHNANAMPIAVWLRDHMDYARNMKEIKQILGQNDVIINGRPCRNPKMGIGIFDIIALPKINRYYRILRDRNGRHVSIEIDAEAAKTRLCKVTNKTVVTGGKVQLNLRDGANLLADNTYKAGDSVVLSLEPGTGSRSSITSRSLSATWPWSSVAATPATSHGSLRSSRCPGASPTRSFSRTRRRAPGSTRSLPTSTW